MEKRGEIVQLKSGLELEYSQFELGVEKFEKTKQAFQKVQQIFYLFFFLFCITRMSAKGWLPDEGGFGWFL